MESLHARFPLPTLLFAGYSVKLLNFNLIKHGVLLVYFICIILFNYCAIRRVFSLLFLSPLYLKFE